MDQIYYWDSLLTAEELSAVVNEIKECRWEFGGRGAAKDDTRDFWYMELDSCTTTETILKSKVESILKRPVEMDRLYANAQAHGQSAWIHSDVVAEEEGEWGSLVYYIHDNWKPQYGGHLIFMTDDETTVTSSIFPKTNSAVMFNSKIKHMALEPTIYCKQQRLSIAYKFKILGE